MARILSTQAEFLQEGTRLVTALADNAVDMPHLELPRQQLEGLLDAAQDLYARQGALTAEKQDVTRNFQDVFENGTKLITFLRKGVAQVYGTRSEKLVEFGMKPFRGRPRRPLAPVPVPEPPTPPPPTVE